MNEHTLTVLSAVLIYASRAKSDDVPEQKAKILNDSVVEAQALVAHISGLVQR